MKILLMFFCSFLLGAHCFAYEVKVDSFDIYVGEKRIKEWHVSIHNDTKEPLCLWLDTLDYSNKDKYIRHYFLKPRGEFSIFNIVDEANIVYPEKFWSFLKVLLPNESFTFASSREVNGETNEVFIASKFLGNLRVFSKNEIRAAFDGALDERAFRVLSEILSYPLGFISLPGSFLEDQCLLSL